MKLSEFLLHKTNAHELCVIRDGGWIVATAWIDSEDLLDRYIDNKILDREVRSNTWDYLPVVNENNASIKIPCHHIDL